MAARPCRGLQHQHQGPPHNHYRAPSNTLPGPQRQGRPRCGRVALRHNSRLHHIGVGRAHKNRSIKLLIADQNIRIIDQQTGQLIRELTLNPNHDYQPINQP